MKCQRQTIQGVKHEERESFCYQLRHNVGAINEKWKIISYQDLISVLYEWLCSGNEIDWIVWNALLASLVKRYLLQSLLYLPLSGTSVQNLFVWGISVYGTHLCCFPNLGIKLWMFLKGVIFKDAKEE